MKHLFFTVSLLLLAQFALAQQQYGILEGILKDSTTQEGLIYANITIYKAGTEIPITGSHTDIEGNYSIDSIPYGIYDIEFSYVGYQMVKFSNISIDENIIRLNAVLEDLIESEIDIFHYCGGYFYPPLIRLSDPVSGREFDATEIEKMPIKW